MLVLVGLCVYASLNVGMLVRVRAWECHMIHRTWVYVCFSYFCVGVLHA